MAQEIVVRRAKPSDANKIAGFVNLNRKEQVVFDAQVIIEQFGNTGFLLAERGEDLVGMLGWRVEDLVVRVVDFLVWPATEAVAVGQALFSEMEDAASALQCEVALLFPPRPTPPALIEFFGALGYELQPVAGMARSWQQAAHEAGVADDAEVLAKQLRTDRVVSPI
jgi:hypothetical protein